MLIQSALAALLVCVLSGVTAARNIIWKTERGLCENEIQGSPRKARVYSAFGTELMKQGKAGEAKLMFQRAIELDPNEGDALNNIATLSLDENKFDEAMAYALRAMAARDDGKALNTLGEIFFKRNEFDKAVAYYGRAIARGGQPLRYYNMALALERLGRNDEACAYWKRYIQEGFWLEDLDDVKAHLAELRCR